MISRCNFFQLLIRNIRRNRNPFNLIGSDEESLTFQPANGVCYHLTLDDKSFAELLINKYPDEIRRLDFAGNCSF
jgi:hypothetical protein